MAADTETRETSATRESSGTSKFTFAITDQARESLEYIAKQYGGISLKDALSRAIGTERVLLEEQAKGGEIVIENPHGRTKQLILR